MSTAGQRPERVRVPHVEQLAERLSPRDWSIVSTIDRLRIASGLQLERLHFHELNGRSRTVKRAQVLKRLVDAGVLFPVERRVGTAHRGSVHQRYALDSAGKQLARMRGDEELSRPYGRRPRVPGDRFIAHTLAVSELCVSLAERARMGEFIFGAFRAEGDAYWPDGLRGWIKPDAFVRLEQPGAADYWWYEADMATEDLSTTIRKKLLTYLDFVRRGQLGPDDVVPRVLVGVPDRKRQEGVQAVVGELPEPAGKLFRVAEMARAAQVLIDELRKK